MTKEFVQDWQKDFYSSEKNILLYYSQVKDILSSEGFENSAIKFGWEIEFQKISYNQDALNKREQEIIDIKNLTSIDEKRDMMFSHKYFPESGNHVNLDNQFDIREKNENGQPKVGKNNRTIIKSEPSFLSNIDNTTENGKQKTFVTAQNEIVSLPLSPLGSRNWLNKVVDVVKNEAKNYGIDGISFTSKFSVNTLVSGLHSNISLFGKKDGLTYNLLQNSSFNENSEANQITPSELALCIAVKRNEFMKEGMLIFAPNEDAFKRFSAENIGAPQFIGFGNKKSVDQMPSAMFRGNGKVCNINQIPDGGDFRIEERMCCNEALGHPDKKNNPSQKNLPSELIEAEMYIFKSGVEMWKQRRIDKQAGKTVPELTEELLLQDKSPLPKNLQEAKNNFANSEQIKSIYGEARAKRMLERYEDISKNTEINFGQNIR